MYTTHVITDDEHQAWFRRNCSDPTTIWYIHENRNNEPDGVVGFTRIDKLHQSATWGFYLGGGVQKGSGLILSIEALDEAFSNLNLQKLGAEVLETNQRSLSFHHKMGFT